MNVLLCSVGRRAYMVDYFKKELGKEGRVICVNSSALSTAMQAGDRAYVSPLIYDADYIPFLLSVCKKENISLLLSLFDIDLAVLARHRASFAEIGVKLVLSDSALVETCNDKMKMQDFLRRIGMNTLYTCLSPEDKRVQSDLRAGREYILKPRWGMGSLGVYKTGDDKELYWLFSRIRREIENSYLQYEARQDADYAILIQECIQGKEYGLDVMNDLEGRYLCTVVKEKLAMRSGETDIAKIVKNEALEDLGRRLAGHTGHIGNMDVDVMVDERGAYIIDMNARFGGGYPFSHAAGANLVRVLLAGARGEQVLAASLQADIGGIYAKELCIMPLADRG